MLDQHLLLKIFEAEQFFNQGQQVLVTEDTAVFAAARTESVVVFLVVRANRRPLKCKPLYYRL